MSVSWTPASDRTSVAEDWTSETGSPDWPWEELQRPRQVSWVGQLRLSEMWEMIKELL